MYKNLSRDETILIRRIVNFYNKGKVSRQFDLVPSPSKPGWLFLCDSVKDFRNNDLKGSQGTIDALVQNQLLQFVRTNVYYLPQTAFDAVANKFKTPYVIVQPVITKPKPPTVNVHSLAKWIEDRFNINELKGLAYGLTNYENLHGDTIAEKSRELVSKMERHGKIHKLIERIKQERPYQIQSLEEVVRIPPNAHM